ncbi:MAG: ABC transporter ATP-binding protein [Paludibacter sp.]|nr:ABC transporter ATP-binding protein [Paludibacter sp.]
MNGFWLLLKRFAAPYKKYIGLSLLFNLLAAVFSLFSFAAIIPILQILFGIEKAAATYVNWQWSDGIELVAKAIKNNAYYSIEQLVLSAGPDLALMLLGVFLVFSAALKVGAAYFGSFFIIPIRTGVVRDLRNQLFSKIVSLPIGYFSEERKGDIMSRMLGDVSEIEASIMSSLDTLFKNPILIVIYLGVMFALSWELTVFVLLLLPFSGWFIGRIGRSLKQRSKKAQEQTGDMLAQIEETLGGLRIVKAFNAEQKVENRFYKMNEDIRRTLRRVYNRHNLAHPLGEIIGTAAIALIVWFGGSLIVHQTSTIGAAEFIYYILIFYSIINPLKDLSKASFSVQKGLASLDRVDTILNAENTIIDPIKPIEINGFNNVIEYKNVSFKYQTEWVLKDVNVRIEKGKTIAFVGQSGSGKSTLVDLLPRYYDVVEGQICIDGVDIRDIKTHDVRTLLGNVNQEAILFNDTFYNNITFGVENATMEQVQEAARIANAHDFIMATEEGYHTSIGDRGSKLSGGQRQRVSIARAILKNPPILILDEATSALDTESEKLVQEALENLMKSRTTLVVAHRLSTIKRADEICVMHEGRIVERGRHDELIELDGYYKRLVDMQTF